jgi:GNAT superfamily N-acetyltransferase
MSVVIQPVSTAAELRTFIRLPANLSDRRANQVLPLWSEEEAYHDPKRNPALKECTLVRYLAVRKGVVVGRIMGIIHAGHNAMHNSRTARFSQLDAIDDPGVTAALVGAIEDWARNQGMDSIIGPFGLSDKDPQGFQIEGFEHLPVLATPSNAAHLPKHVEALGYTKHADALSYRVPIPEKLPAGYYRVADRLMESGEFRMVPLPSRKALKPWILPVLRLVNITYADLLGFVPMDEKEMEHLAAQYMPVLDPDFVKILANKSDEPVAFVVAMPDMSEGLFKAKGKLFPIGFLHILMSMKRTKQLDLFLGAVHPQWQKQGLTCILAIELLGQAHKRGMTHFDSHLILESNAAMRGEVERLGGEVWKRYRVYGKTL